MDIRAERRAAGLSQAQPARAARVQQPNVSAYENGRRVPSSTVLERIQRALAVRPSARVEQHRDSIRALVAKHHATTPRVFGSVARGEDEPGSDVDLLVDFTDEASLLDELSLRLALADLLRAARTTEPPPDRLSCSQYGGRLGWYVVPGGGRSGEPVQRWSSPEVGSYGSGEVLVPSPSRLIVVPVAAASESTVRPGTWAMLSSASAAPPEARVGSTGAGGV